MYSKAMDKVRDEMAKGTDAVCMVGDIVTLYLQSEPANAEKILQDGKTLKGAYGAMRDYARKERKECIAPDEAAEHIAKYYGMKPARIMDMWQAVKDEQPQEKAKPQARAEADDLDLDALLGF